MGKRSVKPWITSWSDEYSKTQWQVREISERINKNLQKKKCLLACLFVFALFCLFVRFFVSLFFPNSMTKTCHFINWIMFTCSILHIFQTYPRSGEGGCYGICSWKFTSGTINLHITYFLKNTDTYWYIWSQNSGQMRSICS